MRALLMAAWLLAGAASAQTFPGGGGGGGGAVTPTDVQAALVGQAISASSYTATTATSPGFQCSQDLEACVRLGTGLRATIGTCNGGAVCVGPPTGSDTGFYVSGFVAARSAQFTSEVDLLGDNAYLRNNSGPVRINDTDGLVLNGTTPLKGRVALAVTFDSASINNGTCLAQAVTVTGAVAGDFVRVNADFDLPDTVMIGNARVTSANTVSLRLCNLDVALPKDPASGPYNFVLER